MILGDFFLRLLPFYLFIFFGYLAGRLLHSKKETIASILIYLRAPIIVFNGALTTSLDISYLSLPLLFFALCTIMAIVFLYIGKHLWNGTEKNILAFTSGTGNTGYFGLPVALAILGNEYMPIIVLILLGFIFYENTVGFYIVAKGNHTLKESLKKLARLPSIYTFFIGLFLNFLQVMPAQIYLDSIINVKGAYSLLGMMLIGLAISEIKNFRIDLKFTMTAFFAKFIIWPLLVLSIISIDKAYFAWYSLEIYKSMILLSIVPLAANTVAYATELRTHPEKAATAVFLSTLFALIYIPLIVTLFLI
ncbi:MAG: AEC family transporter [Candidatus Woesearchaeota archaeon]|nr:AEC family transporter [Candidatus Woesearchaeota archaeon]